MLCSLAAATVLVACAGDDRGAGGATFGTGGSGSGSADGGASGGSTAGDGASDGSGESGASDEDGGGVRFDIGDGMTAGGDEAGGMGCEKVDFLFVVDNSGSMGDEQQNLANNFPRFMDVVQNTLMARDYHIMVVDTDATGSATGSGCTNINGVTTCECQPGPACCQDLCAGVAQECNGWPCTMIPDDACDGTLGAGKIYDADGGPCNVQGGHRYMLDAQPDLGGAFSCVARVGTWGDGSEQPMAAMVTATGPMLNGPGGCNEGFVRDDAILVVTFITDEEDGVAGKSPGDPASWRQALIDAKHGNEEAIVVLGLIGDAHVAGGLPGGPCPSADAAEPSPVLHSFVEQFTYGHLGSICAPDYSGFFTDAVSFIDTACEEFVPPG